MSTARQSLRHRLDIKPAKHTTRPLLTGAIVIGVIVFALFSAAIRHVPLTPRGGHEVSAEFAAANQVSGRTVVRVKGVEVGRVDKVGAGADPSRTSKVTMRITHGGIKLHSDATATIRWRTLFGGLMFIDLDPGSADKPLLGDRPIPASQTANQVELDQFLQPYDGATADHQRVVLKELGDVFADPAGVDHALKALPVLTTVAQGLEPLQGQDADDLTGLIKETARTVHGLDDAEGLKGLATGGARTLAVTAQRRRELGQFIDLSPPSLSTTMTTMARLRVTLGHLDPLAKQLRPGARALAPSIRAATPTMLQTRAVLSEIRPLLKDAGPAFTALRKAGESGVPLMNGLDPTLGRLDSELLPYLRKVDPETGLKLYETIGPFWSDLAMSAAEFDSEGHRIRFTVPPQSNSYIDALPSTSLTRACSRTQAATTPCGAIGHLLADNWFGNAKLPKKAAR